MLLDDTQAVFLDRANGSLVVRNGTVVGASEPDLGILGDPGVNVLMLNLALDKVKISG